VARQKLFLALMIVLAPIGSWVGFNFRHVEYRSVGSFRFNSSEFDPRAQLRVGSQWPPLLSDEYFDAEAAGIRSPSIINSALMDAVWKSWKWPLPDGFAGRLADDLSVERTGLVVEVSVTDADKLVAALGVKTLIKAYHQAFKEEMDTFDRNHADDLQGEIESELAEFHQKIVDEADQSSSGVEWLDELYPAKSAQSAGSSTSSTTVGGSQGSSLPAYILDRIEQFRREQLAIDQELIHANYFIEMRDEMQRQQHDLAARGFNPSTPTYPLESFGPGR
jgi:hypothetical protein